jgi:hypothetical protein
MSTAVEDMMDRIRRMGPRDRRALIRGIVREGLLSEDEEDALVSQSRKHEPAMPADEFFDELSRKTAKGS